MGAESQNTQSRLQKLQAAIAGYERDLQEAQQKTQLLFDELRICPEQFDHAHSKFSEKTLHLIDHLQKDLEQDLSKRMQALYSRSPKATTELAEVARHWIFVR